VLYLVAMHVRVIAPLIGLHLNLAGMAFICGSAVVIAAAILFRLFSGKLFAEVICVAVLFLSGAIIVVVSPTVGVFLHTSVFALHPKGLGAEASEWLFTAWMLILTVALFVTVPRIEGGSDWDDGHGGNPPEDDGGPPSGDSGIDWSTFDRERAGWSRPRHGTLIS